MSNLQDIATMAEVTDGSIQNATTIKVKAPKRILHFSDGTMEEYSDEEDTIDAKASDKQLSVVSK